MDKNFEKLLRSCEDQNYDLVMICQKCGKLSRTINMFNGENQHLTFIDRLKLLFGLKIKRQSNKRKQ